jgi:hypothetical protein
MRKKQNRTERGWGGDNGDEAKSNLGKWSKGSMEGEQRKKVGIRTWKSPPPLFLVLVSLSKMEEEE